MANIHTYYCEVMHDGDIPPGVYRFTKPGTITLRDELRYRQLSQRIWREGPRGGIKLTKNKYDYFYASGYITTDEKYMEEFMWIKLRAKDLS